MKFILMLMLLLVACLAVTSAIDHKRKLINRPPANLESKLFRIRRSEHQAKGAPHRTRGLTVRKGEYMCGNKVCKLRPGDKPPCVDCQYPVS